MTDKSASWRPIETAPLNCVQVLLLIEHPESPLHDHSPSVSIGAYGVHGGGEKDPTWCFAGWDWCLDKYVRGGGTPTHWMPLPPPPEGVGLVCQSSRRSGAHGHTGHRIGEWHGRAKHSDATVRRARELYAEVRSYESVGYLLGVPPRTVADWIRGDTRGGVW